VFASASTIWVAAVAAGQGVEVGTRFIAGQNTVEEMCAAANGLAKAGNTVMEASPPPSAGPAASPAVGATIVGLMQIDAALVHEVCELAGMTAAASPVAEGSPPSASAAASPAPSPAGEGE
jgi:hypothetical protein